jgi:PAS domain S-box-containing protein
VPDASSQLGPTRLASLFDAIVEAASRANVAVAVTVHEPDGPRNVFVNDVAVELMGYTRDEIATLNIWQAIAPEELPALMEQHERRMRGEQVPKSAEVTLVRKDGERRVVEFATAHVEIDARAANVSFFWDVTRRREAREALERSEARFRRLIEALPDAVSIVRGSRILFANPATGRMLGQKPGELAGRELGTVLRPEEAAVAIRRSNEVLETGQRLTTTSEYRRRLPNGRLVTVEVSSLPIDYEDGPAVLSIARDVSERTDMQAQLMQSDRLAAVGRLAAGIAHEINNPIGYVLLNVEYLSRELTRLAEDPSRLPEVQRRVQELGHAAERVASIVRDLRTFARAEDDHEALVDLHEVIEFAIKMSEGEIRHRGRVVTDLARAAQVRANAGRLEQLFVNLLVNAAQALRAETVEQNEIRVKLRLEDDRVVAEVSDTGVGIPPEIVDRVFDPFFTTKPAGSGTGLGLSISRGIAKALGGDISVTSRLGEGTTFRVSLPAALGSARASPPPLETHSSVVPESRLNVLVVDDERPLAAMLGRLLAPRHDVTVAHSGHEALAHLDSGASFDAVLCDLLMPEMTGMELYERVRRSQAELASRFVFMTGAATAARVSDFVASVRNRVLEKPFEIADVLAALGAVARC